MCIHFVCISSILFYHDAFGVYARVLSIPDPANAIMHKPVPFGSRHNWDRFVVTATGRDIKTRESSKVGAL